MNLNDYRIKVYYDVLTDEERLISMGQCNTFLIDVRKSGYPGYQTKGLLHEIFRKKNYLNPFPKFLKLIIDEIGECEIVRSWMNYTDFELRYENWHTHEADYSAVYMSSNPENLGTSFLIEGEEITTTAPTNSLTIFPSNLLHTVPSNVKEPRYSIAIDFLLQK